MAAWNGARWMLAAAATGAAAVAGMVFLGERRQRRPVPAGTGPAGGRQTLATGEREDAASAGGDDAGAARDTSGVAARVAVALRDDEVLGASPVDVAALADDMVELSGRVTTRAQADRAVHAAQAVSGVRTVVNRLEVAEEEERAAAVRQRRAAGDPALQERGAYGMGVGMGRRRQSPATDPDRPDDRNERMEQELAAAEVARQELGGPPATPPGAEGEDR